jgi:hypothetical protein
MFLKVGNEIGWLGFPAIHTANLCFFSGKISAWINVQSAYLVDGVAINGVSGGPAFHLTGADDNPVVVMGVVSAYIANRATGEVLPGLSVVRDVAQFHELTPTFASLDQALEAEPLPEPPPPQPDTGGGHDIDLTRELRIAARPRRPNSLRRSQGSCRVIDAMASATPTGMRTGRVRSGSGR